jgi:AAA domain/UvrD-like helicase C-terminal domain
MTSRWSQRLGPEGLRAVVAILRPNAEFEWDPHAQAQRARRRLQALCQYQTGALEPLDENRRVLVTGGAGSGKTRLAVAWTRRALARSERVWLTCYNDPLADVVAERLTPNELLTVGSFYGVALHLDGMPELDVPDGAPGSWWDTVAVGHLHSNWHHIAARFDTIIVDEAQDLSPAWLAQLEQLLERGGPRRMMLLVDESQTVYQRGFSRPPPDEGWTFCELVNNCRNTFTIASILQRHLGGTAAPVGGPESLDVCWREVADVDAAIGAVGAELDRIEASGHEAPSILVATIKTTVRNRLRDEFAFVRWEDRGPHAIVCENVHRVKGLEFDFVVLVVTTDDVSDLLLYVGLSRAIVGFALIGPRAVAERLGFSEPSN